MDVSLRAWSRQDPWQLLVSFPRLHQTQYPYFPSMMQTHAATSQGRPGALCAVLLGSPQAPCSSRVLSSFERTGGLTGNQYATAPPVCPAALALAVPFHLLSAPPPALFSPADASAEMPNQAIRAFPGGDVSRTQRQREAPGGRPQVAPPYAPAIMLFSQSLASTGRSARASRWHRDLEKRVSAWPR